MYEEASVAPELVALREGNGRLARKLPLAFEGCLWLLTEGRVMCVWGGEGVRLPLCGRDGLRYSEAYRDEDDPVGPRRCSVGSR